MAEQLGLRAAAAVELMRKIEKSGGTRLISISGHVKKPGVYEIESGKVKAFETEPLQVTGGLNPTTKAVPVSFTFPLNKLEPGRYICQVNVLDPAAKRFAFWRAPVVLLP